MGKYYEPAMIRNISLSGAPSSGKTTIAEALLFNGGVISSMGSIDKGTTVMDYDEEEISKKMSIHTSLANFEWKGVKINILDTPGIPDLISEMKPSFYVSENIIFVISAIDGINIDSEKDWHYSDDLKVSKFVFINKIDDDTSKIDEIIDDIENKFNKKTIPLLYPLGKGSNFQGLVNIIKMKFITKDNKITEIPSEIIDKVKSLRDKLIENIAEANDTILEKYLNGEELSEEDILTSVKLSILKNIVIPVAFGSGLKNYGINALLDIIIDYFPSPADYPEIEGVDQDKVLKRKQNANEPFSGFIFKTRIDPYAGRISYCRVYSGKIKIGDEVYNATKGRKEKIAHLYTMIGKNLRDVSEINAGDIAVFTKIDSFDTFDTITQLDYPINYKAPKLANPSYFVAIHSNDRKSEDKLAEIFHTISIEDKTFTYGYNDITKEMVISCVGEIQARIIFDFIKHKYKMNFETRTPRVAYKETITAKAEGHYKHKKQSGGHGQYGEVYLRIEPLTRNGGFEFTEEIFGGAIPKNYVPAIEKGALEACEKGVIAGYPVVDLKVTVYDGSYHEVDSSDMSFRIAGMHATKLAIEAAKPVILEPIAKVKIYVNEEDIGNVMGDLANKRGKVQGMDKLSNNITVINALVPYSEMLSYSPVLNSLTSGRGRFEMEISHYDILPHNEYEKAIKQAEIMKKEEEEKKE